MRAFVSLYFVLLAIPGGILAVIGDLMYSQGIAEEIRNFDRRPHDLSALEPYIMAITYMLWINCGFLLLFGYARFIKRHVPTQSVSGNRFWLLSLAYNLVLIPGNALFANFRLSPESFSFWMVFFPVVGVVLSTLCLDWSWDRKDSARPTNSTATH